MMVPTCNPIIGGWEEVGGRRIRGQGHLFLYLKFKTNLTYERLPFKTNKQTNKSPPNQKTDNKIA